MNRHLFRPLLLCLIAAVGLGAVGFGQTGNSPRLALQYWRAGDYPDRPDGHDESVWVDGHEENSGQGHWEDQDGDGEEETWVSDAYWVDGSYLTQWVEDGLMADGAFGSSWETDSGTFHINSASSTWSSSSGTRGHLLFPYEYYDWITFRAWGLAPANNCDYYSYGVYRPDGVLVGGNSGVGMSYPGGSAMMEGSFFANQEGVWRIDVRYHDAIGDSPEAGTVSYYFSVGSLPQAIVITPLQALPNGGSAVKRVGDVFPIEAIAYPALVWGGRTYSNVPNGPPNGLPVILRVVEGPATISAGNIVTVTGVGFVGIEATQAGGWGFAPAVPQSIGFMAIAATAVTITTQPVGHLVTAGSSLTLTVAVSGTAPFTYRWFKDGVTIVGATAASYSLTNVSVFDAGNYTVQITNGGGSVTSIAFH